jgi:uroporphyrin-3 C-methyltransferase
MSDTNKQQNETPNEQDSAAEDPAQDEVAETTPDDHEGAAADSVADESSEADSVEQESTAQVDGAETTPDDEDAVADDSARDGVAPPAVAPKKRGNGVAWLALLLSVIALAAYGYSFYENWRSAADNSVDDAVAGVESQLTATRRSLSELESRVGNIDAAGDGTAAEIEALRRELDERVRLLSSLPGRMTTLESSMASLAGVSTSARNTWLLAEAEYYLQIANAQLQLANNPTLAAMALSMADERVMQIADPALTDVRRAIADESAALDVMEKPDIAGATLTLASLARVVESLPLARAVRADDPEAESFDAEASGVRRAWDAVKSTAAGLVKVTPPEQEKLALLTPDGESFLRNNIALQLQSARLALLRGEQAVFEQALDDVGALLDDYFDTDSAQVASARATLQEIRGSVFITSVPDISASLRLLRQYRTLAESSQ